MSVQGAAERMADRRTRSAAAIEISHLSAQGRLNDRLAERLSPKRRTLIAMPTALLDSEQVHGLVRFGLTDCLPPDSVHVGTKHSGTAIQVLGTMFPQSC
jgi:hypothetical protein